MTKLAKVEVLPGMCGASWKPSNHIGSFHACVRSIGHIDSCVCDCGATVKDTKEKK